jgi:Holliday junction resolvase
MKGAISLRQREMQLRNELKIIQKKLAPSRNSNYSEEKIRKQYEAKGFTVLRGGWPDFLAIKDGQVIGIEVKSGNDKLRPAQEKMHKALPFCTIIERV